MVTFIALLLAATAAWGQPSALPGSPQPPTGPSPSRSIEEIRKMIWNSPSPAAVVTNGSAAGQVFSPNTAGYAPDNSYKLRAGDKISFRILEDRNEAKMLVVADSGELDVPYVGRVTAVDKTCLQLVATLKELLEKDYYYHATVILALDTAKKVVKHVYVWGQVRTQGPVEILENETLTAGKAILRAGGFGDFANKKKVKLIRNAEGLGGTTKTFELNMLEILEEGKMEKDLVLEPDDFIVVPQRIISY